MYSHSDYSDVWPIFIGQTDKYFKDAKKYIFADANSECVPHDWQVVLYDADSPYDRRVQSCLEQVSEEYVIFHHEDMPLYKEPRYDLLDSYRKVLENESDKVSYIKLIKGGLFADEYENFTGEYEHPRFEPHKDLYMISHDPHFVFAVQPSMWRTEDLLTVYSETDIDHVHEFETMASQVCKQLDIFGLYCYHGESKRGMYHWDSSVYPYIATAIVKGKWNISEYEDELNTLLQEYKISTENRGTV